MSAKIPSYGDYERKGSGGPEGKCRCGYVGPMYHSPTGYECDKCHSPEVLLKLKDGQWFDYGRKARLAADAVK